MPPAQYQAQSQPDLMQYPPQNSMPHHHHQRVSSEPNLGYGHRVPGAELQQQHQQAVQGSFWMRHSFFSAALHDILLWERPVATVVVYFSLFWMFIVLRSFVPDESSSVIFTFCAAGIISALVLLSKKIANTPFAGVLQCFTIPRGVFIAEPSDDGSLMNRAHNIEMFLEDISAWFDNLALELGIAERDEDGVRLTMLGKGIVGILSIIFAFVLSMMSSKTHFILLALFIIAIPPIIRYDLINMLFDSLAQQSSQNSQNAAQQAAAPVPPQPSYYPQQGGYPPQQGHYPPQQPSPEGHRRGLFHRKQQ